MLEILENMQAQLLLIINYMETDSAIAKRKHFRVLVQTHRKTRELLNGARQNTGQPDSDLQTVPTDSDQGGKSGQF